jgi:starch synthase
MGDIDGYGIRFNHASVDDIVYSIGRAIRVYQDKTHFNWMRKHMMGIDLSWENSVQQYISLYESL